MHHPQQILQIGNRTHFSSLLKAQLSAKIDKDILAWLKMHGEVSKFLNQILREKMFEERQKLANPI